MKRWTAVVHLFFYATSRVDKHSFIKKRHLLVEMLRGNSRKGHFISATGFRKSRKAISSLQRASANRRKAFQLRNKLPQNAERHFISATGFREKGKAHFIIVTGFRKICRGIYSRKWASAKFVEAFTRGNGLPQSS